MYELRFDEASARYAVFGPFVVGLLCDPSDLAPLAVRRPSAASHTIGSTDGTAR